MKSSNCCQLFNQGGFEWTWCLFNHNSRFFASGLDRLGWLLVNCFKLFLQGSILLFQLLRLGFERHNFFLQLFGYCFFLGKLQAQLHFFAASLAFVRRSLFQS